VVARPDVKSIRAKLGVSQPEFAAILGISFGALENWEQKRRVPKGPPRVLLKIAEGHPEIVWEVVSEKRSAQRKANA
jgi:putative transcriptional regulator